MSLALPWKLGCGTGVVLLATNMMSAIFKRLGNKLGNVGD